MIFISYNKANKELARLLAMALASLGVSVWFDEWDLELGGPLTAGIEAGLAASEMLVLVWSAPASQSRWVELEIRTYMKRIDRDPSLRLVPLIVDNTPLTEVIRDRVGLHYAKDQDVLQLATALLGKPKPGDVDFAELLQRRLVELTSKNAEAGDPLPYLVCPDCGSRNLKRHGATDEKHDDFYYMIDCADCGWGDWSQ